jgi:hypothetical protein
MDYRFLHFDADYEPTVEDDFLAFPVNERYKAWPIFAQLEAARARMKSDDLEILALSETDRAYIADGEVNHDIGIHSRFSLKASEDINYDRQDNWNLLFQHR